MEQNTIGALFAHNLKLIRQHRKISQTRLSTMTGISKSTLSHLESGSANPSISLVRKITESLGVSFEELISRPAVDVQKVSGREMPFSESKSGSMIRVLPDPFPEVDFYFLELNAQGNWIGTPQSHRAPRILFCTQGEIELHILGETHRIKEKESILFPGEEPHSFLNSRTSRSAGFVITSRLFSPSKRYVSPAQ